MSPKNLFNIILKIFGIFFIKDLILAVLQLLYLFFNPTEPAMFWEALWTLLLTIATLFLYGLVVHYLIFKSDLIIDKLKPGKSFDTEIVPLNVHRSTIPSISIIVVGGLLVVMRSPISAGNCSGISRCAGCRSIGPTTTSPTSSFPVLKLYWVSS